MPRRTRLRRSTAIEQLEVRQVLSALTLMTDTFQSTLPANATSFPTVTVNVLDNDTGISGRARKQPIGRIG